MDENNGEQMVLNEQDVQIADSFMSFEEDEDEIKQDCSEQTTIQENLPFNKEQTLQVVQVVEIPPILASHQPITSILPDPAAMTIQGTVQPEAPFVEPINPQQPTTLVDKPSLEFVAPFSTHHAQSTQSIHPPIQPTLQPNQLTQPTQPTTNTTLKSQTNPLSARRNAILCQPIKALNCIRQKVQ